MLVWLALDKALNFLKHFSLILVILPFLIDLS